MYYYCTNNDNIILQASTALIKMILISYLLMGGLAVCTMSEGKADIDGVCSCCLRTVGRRSSSQVSSGVLTIMLGCVSEPS